MTEIATARSTRTVERALALLAEVCESEPATLSQCARSTRLPASTALRLLRTLEVRSFVTRDGSGTFRAGPRMIQLGALAFGRQALATLADAALRRIVAACGETAYVLIAGPPGSAMTIGMAEGTYSVRHAGWVGHRIAVGDGAIGRSLAGEVGADGYLALVSPTEPDVTAVAAPIQRPLIGPGRGAGDGAVVGVLSVVGPTYRLTEQRAAEVGSVVAREARALAREFTAAVGPVESRAEDPKTAQKAEVKTG